MTVYRTLRDCLSRFMQSWPHNRAHVIVACVSRFALVTQTENQTVRLLYNRCSVCQSVKYITEGSVTI